MTEQQWYAGVGWASESHHVFLTDGTGRKIGEKIFKHSGEGSARMAAWLLTASGAVSSSQIYVAIEVPHGPVVETLIERGFTILALNPKQMDRFRDRFTLAGAKRWPRRRSDGLRLADRSALLAAAGRHRPNRHRTARVVAHRKRS